MQVTLPTDKQSFTIFEEQFRTIYIIVSVLFALIRFSKHISKKPLFSRKCSKKRLSDAKNAIFGLIIV